jgi:hypothetical protein
VSEFVWGTRNDRPLTLPPPLTLADLRWPGKPVAHAGQAHEHGPQTVYSDASCTQTATTSIALRT